MLRRRVSPTLVVLMCLLALALACTSGSQATPTSAPAAPTTAPAAGTTPAATQPAATPVTSTTNAPGPKNPMGEVRYGTATLLCPMGLNTLYCEAYLSQAWGVGEDMFTWRWASDGTIDYDVGQLAVSWDMAPDGKKVVIETRQGVQFHKGIGEMTAEDVAWSYNTVNPLLTPHSIAPSASYFSTLFGDTPAKALDSNHVEFTFAIVDSHWNTYMMNGNGFVGLLIHSKKAFDQNGEEWMKANVVATGPFQVESWTRDDRAVLTAFPDHWSLHPQVNRVIVQAIPEDSVRVAALQTGELDTAALAIKNVTRMVNEGFKSTPNGNASQLGLVFSGNLWEDVHGLTGEPLNTAKSPVYINDLQWLGNPWKPSDGDNPQGIDDMEQARLVRWAVATAIDRAAINETLVGGLGWPVHVPYGDEKSPYWDKAWEYSYDVDMANEYLDKAGYSKGGSGVRFEMPIFIQSGLQQGVGDEIGDALSGMFQEIGIRSEVLRFPYAVFRPGLVDRTATIPRVTAGDDGQAVFPFDWPKGIEESSLSRGGYCVCFESPEITRIYLEVGRELDPQKRIELNKQYFTYMHQWALKPGVVAVPGLIIYNPNSIESWVMEPTPFQSSAFWNIVPKAR